MWLLSNTFENNPKSGFSCAIITQAVNFHLPPSHIGKERIYFMAVFGESLLLKPCYKLRLVLSKTPGKKKRLRGWPLMQEMLCYSGCPVWPCSICQINLGCNLLTGRGIWLTCILMYAYTVCIKMLKPSLGACFTKNPKRHLCLFFGKYKISVYCSFLSGNCLFIIWTKSFITSGKKEK